MTHRIYQQGNIFPVIGEWKNKVIAFNVGNKGFYTLAANRLVDYHFTSDAVCLPLKQVRDAKSVENITDWALDQFHAHYEGALSRV